MDRFEVVTVGHHAQLAEGILWSARENSVYWVDLMGLSIHRIEIQTLQMRSWVTPEPVGWLVERRANAGFIAGFASGFWELTLEPMTRRPIGDPEPALTQNRMNDAGVDFAGRIWAGTMHKDGIEPLGSLYRLDADHRWHTMDSGYLVTNGPAFSPDSRYLYHADSPRRIIYRFEVDVDGSLFNKQPWINFKETWGMPDGMDIDCAGCLWVAHWGGSRITCFTPDGKVERAYVLPVSQVTNCTFAGPNLDRLFVTTAACDREDEILAGELFELDPGGARGLPTRCFAG